MTLDIYGPHPAATLHLWRPGDPDIDPAQLEAERSVAREQFDKEGAFGLCSFISRRGTWEYADGVWGMHPRSYAIDPDNEYREQLMRSALVKLDEWLGGAL